MTNIDLRKIDMEEAIFFLKRHVAPMFLYDKCDQVLFENRRQSLVLIVTIRLTTYKLVGDWTSATVYLLDYVTKKPTGIAKSLKSSWQNYLERKFV